MTLYLDTSALVKLYVEEDGSDRVRSWVERADTVATAVIAYVEARATFARLRKEGRFTPTQLRQVASNLDFEWGTYVAVEVSDGVVRRAGALAEARGLRGYDAVHLSASLLIRDAGGSPSFGCFDDRLARAARREGLSLAR